VERIGAKKFLPLTFHCLRHTYTTLLKIVCPSEAIARELVGHRSQLVSQVYTHLDETTMRNAVKDLPDLFEGLDAQGSDGSVYLFDFPGLPRGSWIYQRGGTPWQKN
jgi:hypothetical protein